MNFLRALFWIVLTIIVVVFSFNNWQPIDINLFSELVWSTKKPVPLMLAFAAGFVPLYIWHRAQRWRYTRRIDAAERALAAAPSAPPPLATHAVEPIDPADPPAAF